MRSGASFGQRLLAFLVLTVLTVQVAGRSSRRHQPRMRVMQKRMEESFKRALDPRTDEETLEDCWARPPAALTAPSSNIWLGLTDDEAAAVIEWLFDQEELNLTTSEEAGSWDNVLVGVELLVPNKTDVLAYVDEGEEAPVRYAHVVYDHRASDEPYFQDLQVGPLPVSDDTTWEPLEWAFTRKTSGKVRNLDADYDAYYDEWLIPLATEIEDITQDLWGGSMTGSDDDTLIMWGQDPLWHEGDRLIRWDTFWRIGDDIYDVWSLQPLGLFVKSDVTGRDVEDWSVIAWLYNGVMYNSTEEFREAYWAGHVEKLGGESDGEWARILHRGPAPAMDMEEAPEAVQPAGARFGLDEENQYVEWMDFSFYIGFDRDRGITLYDIKYKGERIMYELGLQEALAHYAGNDPTQSGTAYLDTFYGFGPYAFELVDGYDCPRYATYLDSKFYMAETTRTHIKSICLFEFDADAPMQRHSTGWYVAATKNIYFTVRFVSTVGNYDYIFSYSFYLDGSISVDVRASGYIQSAFYALNEDYGFQIHDYLSGSMHDHVLNFKADFDILGGANSVQLMKVVPTTETYVWNGDMPRNTMKLERSYLETEDDGRINWGPNGDTYVFVVNQDEPNRFGNPRGYRVQPMMPTIHLTVLNSSDLGLAAEWATTDLSFSVRKDTEPRAAHAYNSQDTSDPPVNFADFFDGESLNQTDLVLWFNLGMHHVPHTGDLPNTVTTNARSGLIFVPINYFEGDQSRRTTQQVRVEYEEGEATTVETWNQVQKSCSYKLSPVEEELWGYTGDIVIRKFPYDPNNPFYETYSIG